MYYVYILRQGNKVLVGKFDNEDLAKVKAKQVKGVVYKDNQQWFDYRR